MFAHHSVSCALVYLVSLSFSSCPLWFQLMFVHATHLQCPSQCYVNINLQFVFSLLFTLASFQFVKCFLLLFIVFVCPNKCFNVYLLAHRTIGIFLPCSSLYLSLPSSNYCHTPPRLQCPPLWNILGSVCVCFYLNLLLSHRVYIYIVVVFLFSFLKQLCKF